MIKPGDEKKGLTEQIIKKNTLDKGKNIKAEITSAKAMADDVDSQRSFVNTDKNRSTESRGIEETSNSRDNDRLSPEYS